ncbi:hypothetical protein P6166_12140 [Stenotrophomonas sp. HITSZ_GD]|uniref:LpxL/LpxP family acyltransferase n=1 Tax=Stenotrophomonas sp. HITSZ_GD TaxID=3037248 RepID=UPI00240D94AB|nr:hypothetical protein [Stenotrophomonas sp. HITSZ_GD]MDG2526106.1 hypothetical protein [Stenotrophomonas sp. HITSZ_GD]
MALFYRWYLVKLLFARVLRSPNRNYILRCVSCLDRTDYRGFDEQLRTSVGRGIVLAIPHHGHYIAAVISLVERARLIRPVVIMYGDPAFHPSNQLFVGVCGALWPAPRYNVEFVHTGKRDLRRCLDSLRRGSVLITLPDAYLDRSDTLEFRFLGRPIDLMLGTASLARRSGAVVQPVVAGVCERSGQMCCRFTNPIEPPAQNGGDFDPLVFDYRSTMRMFSMIETEMGRQAIYWQYVRQHFLRPVANEPVSAAELVRATDSLMALNRRSLGAPVQN